jgi:hypothetical protein
MVYHLGTRHPVIWVTGMLGGWWESTWLLAIYARAPNPREFFDSLSMRSAVLVYGFSLAILAIWLLTSGQRLGRGLEDHLPVVGLIILGPLLLGLALHQIYVFRLLGEDEK